MQRFFGQPTGIPRHRHSRRAPDQTPIGQDAPQEGAIARPAVTGQPCPTHRFAATATN